MAIESAPHGIQYDLPSVFYFEVHKDGTVNRIDNSRRAISDQIESSLYQAYFRALRGECDIYFMRLCSNPKKSLVTVEVRDNHVVQAKIKNNDNR